MLFSLLTTENEIYPMMELKFLVFDVSFWSCLSLSSLIVCITDAGSLVQRGQELIFCAKLKQYFSLIIFQFFGSMKYLHLLHAFPLFKIFPVPENILAA